MCTNTDSRCTTTRSRPRDPLSSSGLSCFLLPTSLCSRQREVGAAPHRGNANRPLTIQGKANALRTRPMPPQKAKNETLFTRPQLLNLRIRRLHTRTIDVTIRSHHTLTVLKTGNPHKRPHRRLIILPPISNRPEGRLHP